MILLKQWVKIYKYQYFNLIYKWMDSLFDSLFEK